MRAAIGATIAAALSLSLCASAALAAGSRDDGAEVVFAPVVVTELIAMPPPTALMSGRVLMKDGVTPVAGAVLTFSSAVYGSAEQARTGRDGRFRLRVPLGEYTLRINRRLDIYESPSTYRVPAGGMMEIDFLLLRDVEIAPPRITTTTTTTTAPRMPDPRRTEPAVVGAVVDMMRPVERSRSRRWAEALGFIGSVLAVAVAAN